MFKTITAFKTEEAFLTFYTEESFPDIDQYVRSVSGGIEEPVPVGKHLFGTNFSLTTSQSELPTYQGYGSKYKNIHAASVISSQIQVGVMLTQEIDQEWIKDGHKPLVLFVDFIDEFLSSGAQELDVLNEHNSVVQTIIIPGVYCVSRNYSSPDGGHATVSLSFVGGEPRILDPGTMQMGGEG